jgi:UrcA family protein
MNTKTHLAARPINPQIAFRAAALGALFTLASVAAFADQPPARVTATHAAKVSLSGVNLSTPEGAHTAYERIKTTAERLCFQLSDSRDIDSQSVYTACVIDTLTDTVRRINAPTLAALARQLPM